MSEDTGKHNSSKYTEAGVDIDKGNAFIEAIKPIVQETHRLGVANDIGGFSSLFDLSGFKNYAEPMLVSSTDGVGTKPAVAKKCKNHNTIGIDLVAMCVNDVVVGGAKPLYFLNYFSTGNLNLETAVNVVSGIAEGCKQAECSLVGGETAEMPGLYQPGDYDLAGFVTGIVDRNKIIDGRNIRVGNKIIGLASSGLHSNGYSLVRKICFQANPFEVHEFREEFGCTLGEELLRPTRIYVPSILRAISHRTINGMVHNTGGGFVDNIPRVLPAGCKAVIQKNSWPIPPIFPFLAEHGNVPEAEMYRVFNMGIGMMCIVSGRIDQEMIKLFQDLGEEAYIIGEIIEADENVQVEII